MRQEEFREKSEHNIGIRREAALFQKVPTTPSFSCFSVEAASGWAGGIQGEQGTPMSWTKAGTETGFLFFISLWFLFDNSPFNLSLGQNNNNAQFNNINTIIS